MGQASSSSVRRVPRDLTKARDIAEINAHGYAGSSVLPHDPAVDREYAKLFKPIIRDSRGNLIARDETGMVLFDIEAFEQITAFEFAVQFSPLRIDDIHRSSPDGETRIPAFTRLLNRYYASVLGVQPGTPLGSRKYDEVMGAAHRIFQIAEFELIDGDRQTPERQTFTPHKPTSFDKNDKIFKTWIDIVEEAWNDKRQKRRLLNDIKNNINLFFNTDSFYFGFRQLGADVDSPNIEQLVVSPSHFADTRSIFAADTPYPVYRLRYFYIVPAVGLRDADGLPMEFETRESESGPYRSLPRLVANASVNRRVALTDPGFLAFLADPRVTPTLHTDPMMNYRRYVKEILIPYAEDKPNIRVPLVNPDMIVRRQGKESIESSRSPDLEVATEGMRQALSREQGGFESVVTPTRRRDEHESQLLARHWSLYTAQDAVMSSLPKAGLGDFYFGRRRIMSRTKFVRLYKRLKGVSFGVASRKYDACMRLL